MRQHSGVVRGSIKTILLVALGISVFTSVTRLLGQDFHLNMHSSGNDLAVDFSSNTNSYYILYSGSNVADLGRLTDMQCGQHSLSNSFNSLSAAEKIQFFKVLQVPQSMPMDSDSDGVYDVFEFQRGTDPKNASSYPDAGVFVRADAPGGGDGSSASPYNTIFSAVYAASNFTIIELADGEYTGMYNRNINFTGKALMLTSTGGPARCIIDCEHSGRAFTFQNGEGRGSVVRGITIRNGYASQGGAIYCNYASPYIEDCVIKDSAADSGGGVYVAWSSPAFRRCIISGNTAASGAGIYNYYSQSKFEACILLANIADSSGGGLRNVYSMPSLLNCTIVANEAVNGGGLYNSYLHSTPRLVNCILWSNREDQIYNEGALPTLIYCDIEGGWVGASNISENPMLTALGRLTADSVCRDAGKEGGAPPLDVDREPWAFSSGAPRGHASRVDIGADEFVDTDSDGMADVWEQFFFGDLSHTGLEDEDPYKGADGLNDLMEYKQGTDPTLSDTDGDELTDGQEVLIYHSSPLKTDSDSDGMPDGWEVAHGLNPASATDVMGDPDNDGYGNVYEYADGSDPEEAISIPEADWFVDASVASSGNGSRQSPFKTIASALSAASSYQIIRLADGIYKGSGNKALVYGGKAVMITSTGCVSHCIIDCEHTDYAFFFRDDEDARSVVRRVLIRNGYATSGGAVYCYLSSPQFFSCIFYNNEATLSGGAFYNASASPSIIQCTLIGNSANYGGAIFNTGSSTPRLLNSILWDNDAESMNLSSGVVSYCAIQGGFSGEGNMDVDPQLTPDFRLMSSSPCIDSAGISNAPSTDMDNEVRWDHPSHSNVIGFVDIGADEFIDTDYDNMADAWERLYWGNLLQDGTADFDAVGGPDGLTDLEEYEQGCDPRQADTDGDGLKDGEEVYTWYTSPLNSDTDGDMMPDGWEVSYSLNPTNALDRMKDPDGDGYGNVYEYTAGSDPTLLSSIPSPSLFVDPFAPAGGDGTYTSPFNTIQPALNAASNYTVVCLADGVYTGSANRNLSYLGKPFMLTSTGDVQNCIVDPQNMARGFDFWRYEDEGSVLRGVTICRGKGLGYDAYGGAIRCKHGSPTIQRCRITGNNASWGGGIGSAYSSPIIRDCLVVSNSAFGNYQSQGVGGGIGLRYGAPVVQDCVVMYNCADAWGGAIDCMRSTATIQRCEIRFNTANDSGGGLYCGQYSPIIEDSIISDNLSWFSGGGVFCYDASPLLRNCFLSRNFAAVNGGGIAGDSSDFSLVNCTVISNAARHGGGLFGAYQRTNVVINSIVWGNSSNQIYTANGYVPLVSWSDVQDGYAGDGNIDIDPMLIPGCDRLKAQSPCIDAGTASSVPVADFESESRWDAPTHSNRVSTVDIGADELVDIDSDQMADNWEYQYFGSLSHTGGGDGDTVGGPDGLNDLNEYRNGTNPNQSDTDSDDISDYDELYVYLTSPLDPDTDNDRIPEGWEIRYGFDPLDALDVMDDPDGDRFGNYYEFIYGTSPTNAADYPVAQYYVDAAAVSGGNGSLALPFNTIQAALTIATANDIIQVADGVYRGAGNKDLDYQGKAIMLMATGSVDRCVIDCEESGRGIYFDDDEGHWSVVCGLTLCNSAGPYGGGIMCSRAAPTIQYCVVRDNCISAGDGGGIYCAYSNAIIDHCQVLRNHAGSGGGIYCHFSSPLIRDCVMVDNEAGWGGGLCGSHSGFTLQRSLVVSNWSAFGGGVYSSCIDPVIEESDISWNVGAYSGGGLCCYSSSPSITACIIDGNEAQNGAGIYMHESDASIIQQTKIRCNISERYGGGIYCYTNAHPIIKQCRIEENESGYGGGLCCAYESAPVLENCLLRANRAFLGGAGIFSCTFSMPSFRNCTIIGNLAKYGGGALYDDALVPLVTMDNCIVWQNQPKAFDGTEPIVMYSVVQGGISGAGNTNVDPCLVPLSSRLRSDSPCIDAGMMTNMPLLDMDQESRFDDPAHPNVISVADIGMDEFVDSDADGMADDWELSYFQDLSHDGTGDSDVIQGPDSLTDLVEYEYGTNPLHSDSDGDGMSDDWEILYGLNPLDKEDAETDVDQDTLSARDEYEIGTNPNDPDTDDDGLSDSLEIGMKTDPLSVNTNGSLYTVDEVLGSAAINRIGDWYNDGDAIVAGGLRGSLDYTIHSPTADVYLIEVEACSCDTVNDLETFELAISLNDERLGRSLIFSTTGSCDCVHMYTPWLPEGDYGITVLYDNALTHARLKINAIRLRTFAGDDENMNGIKDWAEHRLSNICSLESAPGIIATGVVHSFISPACLEGKAVFYSMLNASSNAVVRHGAGDRWTADVPLSAASATPFSISFQNEGYTSACSVVWDEVNVLTSGDMKVRQADSLLLSAVPTNAGSGTMQVQIAGVTNYTTTDMLSLSYCFSSTGTYAVTGTFIPDVGSTVGNTMMITAVSSRFPTNIPEAWVGKERAWTCPDILDATPVEYDPRLIMENNECSYGGRELAITTDVNDPRFMVTRLNDNGPVLDSSSINSIRFYSTAGQMDMVITNYADGSKLIEEHMIMSPVLPDVTVEIRVFVSGVTFDDGTTYRRLTHSDFSETGEYRCRFFRPASVKTSICHWSRLYQGDVMLGYYGNEDADKF